MFRAENRCRPAGSIAYTEHQRSAVGVREAGDRGCQHLTRLSGAASVLLEVERLRLCVVRGRAGDDGFEGGLQFN